ncbi:MAG: Smr/MutS family protein [Bacteroidia bacterium]|nr:Smr/MutS family protein [Bacteroidia bacterium]
MQKSAPTHYPANLEEKLGFDKVKAFVSSSCSTDLGKSFSEKIRFSTEMDKISEWLKQTDDMQRLMGSGFYLQLPQDLLEHLQQLNALTVDGLFLYEDQLYSLKSLLISITVTVKAIANDPELYPALFRIIEDIQPLDDCIKIIDGVLDKEGKLRFDASPELKKISQGIQQKEKDVRRLLTAKFEYARKQGWAGDTGITIRNERLVIPVIAEHKRKIPGFVHDDSQSGKFLYIEPVECLEENNLLKELYIERKKEAERILREVARQLSPHYQNITFSIRRMGLLDFISAKARFSLQTISIVPDLNEDAEGLILQAARHPVLFLQMSRQNLQVVPLDIELNELQRCIVVSGPNAGGKSITLKTVGLLQYMLQCGFPVPAKNGTAMRLFSSIFIDIGDNQSIEQNLSSYSSHLKSMKHFINNANEDTLFLIDELGTGTDPLLGAPMAEAILETLFATGAYGIVTTHFSNLKTFASNTEGMVNAGMAYDLEHLEPLYRLQVGVPGSSFTFEVAKKIGLNKKVLNLALEKNKSNEFLDLENLLSETERSKNETESLKQRLKEKESYFNDLISEYEKLKVDILGNRKKIISDANLKALQLVSDANKDIERTIKEIKENKADKEKTKEVREKLNVKAKKITELLKKEEVAAEEIIEESVAKFKLKPVVFIPGMLVQIKESTSKGEILELNKSKALVLFGIMQTWVKLTDIEPYSGSNRQEKKQAKEYSDAMFNKKTLFSTDLDIRGERGDAAMQKVTEWLDDAHMLGYSKLKIIHGRGTGILRRLMTDKLKSLNYVSGWQSESEQFGGDGVTLIELK